MLDRWINGWMLYFLFLKYVCFICNIDRYVGFFFVMLNENVNYIIVLC